MKTAKVLSYFGLSRMFPDEDTVIRFLEGVLWGDKPVCPRCQCTRTSPRPHRKAHRCNGCREEFSVRTLTIFAQTRLPLVKWIFAAYLLQTARKGISSLQLSKEIEVTQKTAWFLLHRLRTSCAPEVGALLSGVVEADEAFIGGLERTATNTRKWAPKAPKTRRLCWEPVSGLLGVLSPFLSPTLPARRFCPPCGST